MSSTALSKEKLAELVKCVLCMKTFTSPQTMKCLHTFCKHCLENHAKRSSVDDVQGLECPRCKQFTAQSDVTTCTRTEQLLTMYECGTKRKMCFQCETESAEWKCQDCGDFYCETCKKLHSTIRKFKDHMLIAVQDLQHDVALAATVNCLKHLSEEAKYYCFDCDVLICALCLLQGHDGHKRDTVHNAVDHVKAKVDEKLKAVKQITNERFLRAEKLKDTRLLIQTYADESFDAIKSRYEFLKHKLDEDYQSLTHELKTSVDAEFQTVNAAIVAEEAKQSHATAVTSYVEITLITTSDAMLIQESVQQLISTMQQFCDVEGRCEAPMTSHFYRFRKTDSSQDLTKNLIGEIETVAASFHGRYQPKITKEQLESATVRKTIDINIGKEAKGYRMNVGFDKIVVCFWDINTILVYNSDGADFQVDLSGKLNEPHSAIFVDASHIMVATTQGLVLVDLKTSSVVSMVKKGHYSDMCYLNNTVFALNVRKHRLDMIKMNGKDWTFDSISLTRSGKHGHGSSTAVTSPNRVNFCNHNDQVLQFSLSGELLQTVTVNKHKPGNSDLYLCAVDADGRMLLSVGRQLVLQHNDQSQVIKLKELTYVQDIVFDDPNTFWILEYIDLNRGQYKLIKYTT